MFPYKVTVCLIIKEFQFFCSKLIDPQLLLKSELSVYTDRCLYKLQKEFPYMYCYFKTPKLYFELLRITVN